MTEHVVIYLAGYGRSGTTVLESALGSVPGVRTLGELVKPAYNPATRCSCGETPHLCTFWSAVIARLADRGRSWPVTDADAAHLLAAVVDVGGDDVLVDASKTTRRSRHRPRTYRRAGWRVVGVHVVRDPTQVLASVTRGTNRHLVSGDDDWRRLRPLRMVRAAAGWVVANHLDSDDFDDLLTITFDELVTKPEETVQRVLDAAGVAGRYDNDAGFGDLHALGGNRTRTTGPRRIVARPTADASRSARLLGSALRRLARRRGLTVRWAA